MNNNELLNVPVEDLIHAVNACEAEQYDELYHHGVVGMKWGVRRTPAQLGHKTGSKKRRSSAKKYVESLIKQHKNNRKIEKEAKKIDKAAKKAEAEERKKNAATKKKSIEEMSDDELSKYIVRKNAEKMALGLERDINGLKPEKVSMGQKLAAAFGDKAINTLAGVGEKALNNAVNKMIEKALGDGAADPLMALKKEAEKAGYQQTIANAKNAYEKAKWQEYVTKDKEDEYNAKKAASKAESAKASAKSTDDSSKVYEGTVEWGDFKKATSSQQKAGKTVVDAESWSTTPASGTSNSTRQLGQSYIAGLLPAPKDDD